MTPRSRVLALPNRNRPRRPTPAELGDVLTIAIVALTAPMGHFVSVSDQMISYDDTLPADESALIKNLQLTKNWSVAFAANKIENILPLLDKVRSRIKHPAENLEAIKLQEYFTTSIAEMIRTDFFNQRLARYAYRDIDAFLQFGKDQLGDIFFELCRELNEADLGVELIAYGYESGAHDPQIFEVNGKGQVIDRMALRYAVVGSGFWMASASLKRKPLDITFEPMVYRLLEAKFSAETASGVGKRTTVSFKRPDQHDFRMWPPQIDEIRAVWEEQMRQYEPMKALEIVGKIKLIMLHSDQSHISQLQAEKAAHSPGAAS
jgi:hypothetical protein